MERITVLIAITGASLALFAGDPGQVYVYAKRGTAARSWFLISCDSVVAAELKPGAFFAIRTAAGVHMLSVEKGVSLPLEVHSEQDLFVRLDWNQAIGRPPIAQLVSINEDVASREMKYLSYVGARRIHSSLVPKTDPSPPVTPELRRRDPQ